MYSIQVDKTFYRSHPEITTMNFAHHLHQFLHNCPNVGDTKHNTSFANHTYICIKFHATAVYSQYPIVLRGMHLHLPMILLYHMSQTQHSPQVYQDAMVRLHRVSKALVHGSLSYYYYYCCFYHNQMTGMHILGRMVVEQIPIQQRNTV